MRVKKNRESCSRVPSRSRPRVSEVEGDDQGAEEITRRVASALKRHRQAKKLSLDELASQSGVSRAALSQIEAANTNPTLAVLWKIAAGLDVPFHALLGLSEDSSLKVLRSNEATVLRNQDGGVEFRFMAPGGVAAGLGVDELRLAPNAIHKSEPHNPGTTETILVIDGSVRVTVGEAQRDLVAGDSMFFHADVEHAYENPSSEDARLVNIIQYGRSS
jgi:XRE family transcriptional regulator, regulator of sulfur utilization